jgi:hypothetical protein
MNLRHQISFTPNSITFSFCLFHIRHHFVIAKKSNEYQKISSRILPKTKDKKEENGRKKSTKKQRKKKESKRDRMEGSKRGL